MYLYSWSCEGFFCEKFWFVCFFTLSFRRMKSTSLRMWSGKLADLVGGTLSTEDGSVLPLLCLSRKLFHWSISESHGIQGRGYIPIISQHITLQGYASKRSSVPTTCHGLGSTVRGGLWMFCSGAGFFGTP